MGIIHEACSILRILTLPSSSSGSGSSNHHHHEHHEHHEDRIENYSPNLNSFIYTRTQSHLISSAKKSAGVVVAAAAATGAVKPNSNSNYRSEYAVSLERRMKDSYSEDSELTDSSGHTSSFHFQANLNLDLDLDFDAKPMDKVASNAEQIVNTGGVQLLLQILSHFDVIIKKQPFSFINIYTFLFFCCVFSPIIYHLCLLIKGKAPDVKQIVYSGRCVDLKSKVLKDSVEINTNKNNVTSGTYGWKEAAEQALGLINNLLITNKYT